MNRSTITPILFIVCQLAGIAHILYSFQYGHSHIPVAFIELNILAIFSGFALITSWFLYFKAKQKSNIWRFIIGLSVSIITGLVVTYIVMALDKYQ